MENQQEAWSAVDDKDEQVEYHFVYNRATLIKAVGFGVVLLILFVMYMWVESGFYYFYPPTIISIMVVASVFFLILFSFYYLRLSITLNQEGITCTGFWFGHMPRHYAWGKLSKIGKIRDTRSSKFGPTDVQSLVFISNERKLHFLTVGGYGYESFIGIEHALSLEEAITRFVGPIKQLNKTRDQGGIVPLYFLALGILGLLFLYFFLMAQQVLPFLLGDLHGGISFGVINAFLGAFVVSSWYRWQRFIRRTGINVFTLVFGFMVALSFILFIEYLPKWQGKEEQVVFTISKENNKRQYWTATTDAELTFHIRTYMSNRVYSGVGTERTMTIYRGPGFLKALPEHECYALYHKVPKGRRGNSRPGRCR